MRMEELPENVRRCIPKDDRQEFGKAGVTSAEAQQKFERNAERKLHEQIVGFLRIKGVRFIVRSRMDRKTTNAVGTPDIIFCFCSKFIALEVKVGTNNLTNAQRQALEDIIEDGGISLVVRSLEAVKTLLDGLEANREREIKARLSGCGPSEIPQSESGCEPEQTSPSPSQT